MVELLDRIISIVLFFLGVFIHIVVFLADDFIGLKLFKFPMLVLTKSHAIVHKSSHSACLLNKNVHILIEIDESNVRIYRHALLQLYYLAENIIGIILTSPCDSSIFECDSHTCPLQYHELPGLLV